MLTPLEVVLEEGGGGAPSCVCAVSGDAAAAPPLPLPLPLPLPSALPLLALPSSSVGGNMASYADWIELPTQSNSPSSSSSGCSNGLCCVLLVVE